MSLVSYKISLVTVHFIIMGIDELDQFLTCVFRGLFYGENVYLHLEELYVTYLVDGFFHILCYLSSASCCLDSISVGQFFSFSVQCSIFPFCVLRDFLNSFCPMY